MEYQAHDSGAAVIAQHDGKVTYADAHKVEVRREDGAFDVYHIQKFRRSNSGTAYNQRTLQSWRCRWKKATLSLTVHRWKKGKWPLVKTQSSLYICGKV